MAGVLVPRISGFLRAGPEGAKQPWFTGMLSASVARGKIPGVKFQGGLEQHHEMENNLTEVAEDVREQRGRCGEGAVSTEKRA